MQVNRVQANYNKPTFEKLLVTARAQEYLKDRLTPAQLEEVKKFKEELADTKQFDLELDAGITSFYCRFKHKTNSNYNSERYIELGQFADDEGTQLYAWGLNDKDPFGTGKTYLLKFPNNKVALEEYRKVVDGHCYDPKRSRRTFDVIGYAVQSTKVLDKYFDEDLTNQCNMI